MRKMTEGRKPKSFSIDTMAVIVSLIRGINVGGKHMIKMDALRALYESIGLRDPRSYVQSGNVLFLSTARSLPALATKIEAAIESEFGFRPSVILRTADDLRDVVKRNPFAHREGIEPAKLLVTFLAADPPPGAAEKLASVKKDREELVLSGRELFIDFPDGIGRAKLNFSAADKAAGPPGTGRNWNSVLKMIEIADSMEA